MISEELALQRVLDSVEPLGAETLPLATVRGRFMAREFFAHLPLPMFDNSAMDGYAVHAADCRAREARLRVVGEQPAGGERGLVFAAGEAVRIFTGAPIPRGADAVVMQEDVNADGEFITTHTAVEPGENIRRQGSDLCVGQKIAASGDAISPQLASLLASQGLAEVSVGRMPHVAILTTGDELLAPGEPLVAGKIYESNGVLLEMLVASAHATVTRLGSAPDEPQLLREKLAAGLEHDALIVSGGVSVGERDFVKDELRNLGAQLDLWRVAVRPGKPFLFGQKGRCKIFGLPGNPVSTFVTWQLFVRPALLKMAGAREWSLPCASVCMTRELRNDSDRPHYVRGKISTEKFTPFGRQESHALFGLSQSNALVRIAPRETIPAGATVRAMLV